MRTDGWSRRADHARGGAVTMAAGRVRVGARQGVSGGTGRARRVAAALAANARGVVRDGAFVDSLRPYESSSGLATDLFSRQAAGERAGTYTVEVEHDGYQPWTIAGVRASRGVCHVETRRLAANLQPAT